MSNLQKIIQYFFHHSVSDEMVEKVHKRLSLSGDEEEKEEALQSIWNEIGYPEVPTGQALQAFSRLEQQIDGKASSAREKRSFSIRFPHWMRMAALWLIPLLTLSLSYYMYREARSIQNKVAQITFIERYVPSGKRELVTLPDSSKVWLNSGSLLVYPSAFIGDYREIYLAGEGYFAVQKNPASPFIVKTHALQVEVLGTKFNLSAYPDAEKIVATLEQGSINVRVKSIDTPYLLKPNNQLVYLPKNGLVRLFHVAAVDYCDWKEGGLYFNNSSLKDMLTTLERAYNVTVHVQTSSYHDNRLTIHFNKNESLETVMLLIKEMIPGFEYLIEGTNIYIR